MKKQNRKKPKNSRKKRNQSHTEKKIRKEHKEISKRIQNFKLEPYTPQKLEEFDQLINDFERLIDKKFGQPQKVIKVYKNGKFQIIPKS